MRNKKIKTTFVYTQLAEYVKKEQTIIIREIKDNKNGSISYL